MARTEDKTLGILLLSSPYTHQSSHTLYELAVNNAKLGQDPDPDIPMNDRLNELAEMGAEFQACGLCTSARGFDQNGSDFIDGVEVTGLTEFAEIVGEVDRFVTFSLNR
ncbi:MAG: DsrE/DsrF/TusD sulfur relay family protein [Candidatus Thorarchaeota archaeon]|jgi:sulfur relay (sulfurtransferase) complex TusBCD TusD component (DsrE family)